MIELLANYPEWVSLCIADPVRGLPGKFKFCPQIAEIKEACDGWVNEQARTDELRARYSPRPLGLTSKWDPPRLRNEATVSALCRRFGIRDVPPGWDAVDVTRQAARHGREFPNIIDGVLKQGPPFDQPLSAAQQVVKRAREAMERRLGEAAE